MSCQKRFQPSCYSYSTKRAGYSVLPLSWSLRNSNEWTSWGKFRTRSITREISSSMREGEFIMSEREILPTRFGTITQISSSGTLGFSNHQKSHLPSMAASVQPRARLSAGTNSQEIGLVSFTLILKS
jgi:hypothetical protein